VGVWTGNLDGSATSGITESVGPALVLRAVFDQVNRHRQTRPLYVSPKLVKRDICRATGTAADGICPSLSEWFMPGTEPPGLILAAIDPAIRFVQPTAGLHLALDARIPDGLEAIDLQLSALPDHASVDWYVNGRHLATTSGDRIPWHLSRGAHTVKAQVKTDDSTVTPSVPDARFYVK
jgi:penicillin-binding protein 1C